MSRPFTETPILYGEDAMRFREAMKNVVPETPEKMAQMKADYEFFLRAFNSGEREEECNEPKS